jgi:hypothetical protein
MELEVDLCVRDTFCEEKRRCKDILQGKSIFSATKHKYV